LFPNTERVGFDAGDAFEVFDRESIHLTEFPLM